MGKNKQPKKLCKKCYGDGHYLIRLPDEVGSPNEVICDCPAGQKLEAQIKRGLTDIKAGRVQSWDAIKQELDIQPSSPAQVEKPENPSLQELIDAYDAYVKLLEDEDSELSGLAVAHGWVGGRYVKGIEARKRIEEAKYNLASALSTKFDRENLARIIFEGIFKDSWADKEIHTKHDEVICLRTADLIIKEMGI